jgi:hypothetical protein
MLPNIYMYITGVMPYISVVMTGRGEDIFMILASDQPHHLSDNYWKGRTILNVVCDPHVHILERIDLAASHWRSGCRWRASWKGVAGAVEAAETIG